MQAESERKQLKFGNIVESTKGLLYTIERADSSLKKANGEMKHQEEVVALDNNYEQKSHEFAQKFLEKQPKREAPPVSDPVEAITKALSNFDQSNFLSKELGNHQDQDKDRGNGITNFTAILDSTKSLLSDLHNQIQKFNINQVQERAPELQQPEEKPKKKSLMNKLDAKMDVEEANNDFLDKLNAIKDVIEHKGKEDLLDKNWKKSEEKSKDKGKQSHYKQEKISKNEKKKVMKEDEGS